MDGLFTSYWIALDIGGPIKCISFELRPSAANDVGVRVGVRGGV